MAENKKLKLVELFSGIGSQAKALKNIGANFEVMHTCEWNIHAMSAYACIHNCKNNTSELSKTKEELVKELAQKGISNDGKKTITERTLSQLTQEALEKIYTTIVETKNLVDISSVKAEDFKERIDILTYSFPCQDLSNVGALHGYNKGIDRDANNRSGLLWEVERILLEMKNNGNFLPRYLLLENVPALKSSRHIHNFREWQKQLESLGYYNKQYVLNAKDFGLPQNRERLLMLSVLYDDEEERKALDQYFTNHNLELELYRSTLDIKGKCLSDLLRIDYTEDKYKREALECQPNNTESRKKIWNENLKITDEKGEKVFADFVATITTKQDRHPNSGNIGVKGKLDDNKAVFRYLTPRECFLLMGFEEEDYEKVLKGNFITKKDNSIFTRDGLIKMAGNSIAVNVLEAVFQQVIDLENGVHYKEYC